MNPSELVPRDIGTTQNHEAFQKTIELSGLTIFRWQNQPGWPVAYVSDNIQQLGYSPMEFYNHTVKYQDIIHPDDLEKVIETRKNLVPGEDHSYELKYRLLSKSGQIRWVDEWSWMKQDSGETSQYIHGIILDITRRRKVEKENARLKGKLEQELYKLKRLLEFDSLIQSQEDPAMIMDTALVTITAGNGFKFNRAFLLLVDQEQEWLTGETAVGPLNIEEAHEIYQNIAAQNLTLKELVESHFQNRHQYDLAINKVVKQIRIDIKKSDFFTALFKEQSFARTRYSKLPIDQHLTENLKHTDLTIVPLIVNNLPLGVIIVDHLIAPTKISEDDLELLQLYANRVASALHRAQLNSALNQEIQKTRAAKVQLTEINSKLIQTEKMAAMGEITSEIAHEIRNPLVSIGGFARTLSRTLDPDDPNYQLIKIIIDETRRLENILDNVLSNARNNIGANEKRSLFEPVEQAIKLLEFHKLDKSINIQLDFPQKELLFHFDYEKFIQIFFNLIKNAIQASKQNGKILIKGEQFDHTIIISVKDYGTGISSENLDKVFHPFFTTKSSGIGLGLSIVKQIIKKHGGNISFLTEEGEGTEFIITLNIKER